MSLGCRPRWPILLPIYLLDCESVGGERERTKWGEGRRWILPGPEAHGFYMHRLRPSSRTLGRDCSTKARNLQHIRQKTEGYRNQFADLFRHVQCEGMTRRDTAGAPPIYVRALRPLTVAGGRTGRISSLPSPHETRARSRPLRLGRC